MGPPPGTDWSAQWHDILDELNMRADYWSHANGIPSWSKKCMTQSWNFFASYIANLPAERWVRRTLAWQPGPTYPPRGHPQQNWDTKQKMFCKHKAVRIGKLLREMREMRTYCYHQHHREGHLFDSDKGTVKSKSIGLKYFVDAKFPTTFSSSLYRRLSINPY